MEHNPIGDRDDDPVSTSTGGDGGQEADVFLDIEADPDRVWRALTTDGGLAPWMGEGATVDPRPGGLVALPDPVGGSTRRGRVERVDEGDRLDFTWWPALRPADRTSVSITVSPTDSGCRVRVIERQTPATTTAAAGRATASIGSSVSSAGGSALAAPASGSVPVARSFTRSTVAGWSWRLALLSLSSCMSRI